MKFQCQWLKMLTPVTVLLILFFSPVSAQLPDFKFKHLDVNDGLTQSTVSCIIQDHLGFMWFGTEIGINKYDGTQFICYRHDASDSTGIPSNFIDNIIEDSYGIFWIATGYSGLCRFNAETEIFTQYLSRPGDDNSLSNNNIRAVFEDSRKNLWIGTAGGGLNLYDRKTDKFKTYMHDSLSRNDIGSNYITSIAEDKEGYLWLGTSEGVLTRFNPATGKGKFYELYNRDLTDKTTANFGQVYLDSRDDVWYCTENGLYLFDRKTNAFSHFIKGKGKGFLNENAVSDIEEIGNGYYIIATDHGGINLFNRNAGTFNYYMHSDNDLNSISNDQVYTIYKAHDGVIWIGNYNGGINILDPEAKKFGQYKDLPIDDHSSFSSGSVLSICEDQQKNIWFGYDGQGINIYNRTRHFVTHLTAGNSENSLRSNSIVEVFRSRNGDMWIGTYLQGMTKIDAKTGKYTHYKHNSKNPLGIGGNNVWSIAEDNHGSIWIGFVGSGLDRFDLKENRFYHYKYNAADSTTISNESIYKVFEDNKGNLWVGTRNGLCLYNSKDDNFKRFISAIDKKNGIYGNFIYDIYQDHTGNLWIGTDQALNLFHPWDKTFEHFDLGQGNAGNAVLSITGDNNGNLWLSTNRGLSRFNIHESKFRNYDVADGLLTNEFNFVSVLNASDGHIYFGSKSGFNFFDPDSIFDNQLIPKVYITNLKINNEEIRPRKHPDIIQKHISFVSRIVLNHKQSVITLNFASLNYSNSQKNQYAYKLEGFDKGWIYCGNRHEVTYTNLDPGNYRFIVKGSNNDGLWNNKGAVLAITILPPWWKSLWFKILIYSLALGFIFLVYYLRQTIFERQRRKLMHLVRDRTLQLEEVAVALEEKQEEINAQNEKLRAQRDELENNNQVLTEQKQRILDQNAELDVHRNQLETLVEERTRELIEAKNKAEESDKLKSSFLANLSHEIRTPLNAILGFSALLGEKSLNNEEREEYNRIIQGSSNTLLELINDILDISKIEAGQLQLNMHEVSLESIINDVTGIFDMFMKREDLGLNKSVELKVTIDDSLRKASIVSDSLRLSQILSNLINNAIKFTRKGYIEVGCNKMDSGMLRFHVKDTGIGIKPENQQLVFERFRKLEDDKFQLHRGTGLGLAISYQLVSLMGGDMWVESEYGKGSIFYFTIPMITKGTSSFKPAPRKAASDVLPDFKNISILVAEDDIANFSYIDKLLKNANVRVYHAEDGKQAIRLLEMYHEIKIVLMDIKMPVMDGIEALRTIRKSGTSIPVIAQTAYALADEVVRLKKEGFDEYLSKPIQREKLYAVLARYIQHTEQ